MEETENIKTPKEEIPKKKSLPKRLLKIFLYLVLALIGLNVLLYVLLSIPAIQQKAADFAVKQLKSTLKTEVAIDELRLSLFNHVTLKGIYIEDQAKDTLLYASSLDVTLSPWEFIRSNKLAITSVTLDDFYINISKKDSVSDLSFQFVIDAFSSTDTTKVVDTTKSSLKVVIEDIRLNEGRLRYNVLSDSITPGIFNASHISLYDLNINVDLNSIDPDKFDIALNSLSAKEISGVEIKDLKAHFYSEKSQLWVDGLALNLANSHLKTDKARYNLSTSEVELITEDTEIAPSDLVAFLPNLRFLTNNISLKTNIKGKLPAIDVEKINLVYGEDLILDGYAKIDSYEKYGSSDVNLSIDKFKATPAAITSFARIGDSTFVAPDILKTLGDVYLKGKVTGQLNKFQLDMETWCKQGLLTLLATGSVDTTFTNFNVNGKLNTQNFNLGTLLGQQKGGLGRLSANVTIQARQNEKQSLRAEVQGAIIALQYDTVTFRNLAFKGFYNDAKMGLAAKADWKIGKIKLDANMSQARVPDINVYLRVDTFHVDKIYKNESWINPRLTMALRGNIKGLDINNLSGTVSVDSLDFNGDDFKFKPGKFTLEAGKNDKNDKFINLTSSFLSANIEGQYTFTSIGDEMTNLMNKYLSGVFQKTKRITKSQNNFAFNIAVQNTEELGRIFALPANIILPATINGRINTIDQQISIKGNVPHVRYGQYDIKNTIIDIVNVDSAFEITGGSKVLMEGGNYKLSLKIDGADNSVHTLINVDGDSSKIAVNGKIEALAQFSRDEKNELVSSLKIIPSDIKVDKLVLNLLPAEIVHRGVRTEVKNLALGVNSKKYFGANGIISAEKTDSLRLYFDHAEIGELLKAFDVKNIEGCVHGNVLLTSILGQPELYTEDFEIADIVIFSDTLGTLNVESQWSEDFGGAQLSASLIRDKKSLAEVDGTIYTKQDSLDLQVRLVEMPMAWIQPFVGDMLNKVSGSISTNLMIEGSTKAPKLRGFLGFNKLQLGIDYTNVVYTISDTISISPHNIGFDNLVLQDSEGNTANVKASVTHNNFADMKYSLTMQMNKLMVLNTADRTDSLFYGKVYTSGNVKVDGDDKGIVMDMQLKNEKNSSINILLPQHSEASDYQSVVYINVPPDKLEKEKKNAKPDTKPLPIQLKVKMDINPDMLIGVIINPSTGDAMEAKGRGTIDFSYNMENQNMTTYGDYTLTDGNVKLNLQKLKKLQFNIQDGSKLYFIGDPLKTRFDITAFRRINADLKTLDSSFGADGQQTKTVVDLILGIEGNMDKMNLEYNISLPEASDDLQRKVSSYINTDDQKLRQFAYLIATGAFYGDGSSGAGFSTEGIWTSLASTTLSKGLTTLMGNVLGNKWQIGANIESNDGSFNDLDMTVNVSRKFLDDKITFKTNLGYRTEQSTTSGENFIGDFDLEYQLNSMWTLRGYSHTNDEYYTQAQTTQGIGIVYSKEAATLKRLFQSFKPKRSRATQQPEKQPTDSTKTVIPPQPIINNEKKE